MWWLERSGTSLRPIQFRLKGRRRLRSRKGLTAKEKAAPATSLRTRHLSGRYSHLFRSRHYPSNYPLRVFPRDGCRRTKSSAFNLRLDSNRKIASSDTLLNGWFGLRTFALFRRWRFRAALLSKLLTASSSPVHQSLHRTIHGGLHPFGLLCGD